MYIFITEFSNRIKDVLNAPLKSLSYNILINPYNSLFLVGVTWTNVESLNVINDPKCNNITGDELLLNFGAKFQR